MSQQTNKIIMRSIRKISDEYQNKYSLKKRIDYCNRWNALLVHAGILEPQYFRRIRHIEACY